MAVRFCPRVGQHYRRRRDGYTATIKQVHRMDRIAEVRSADVLVIGERPRSVRFTELREQWELVAS